MKVLSVSVMLNITALVSANFLSLYVTQRLGITERYLAFFPILNAIVMLVFMIGIQHRLESVKFRRPILAGLALSAACTALLIITPAGGLLLIIAVVFVKAVSNALLGPRTDALLQLNIDPRERARINALVRSFTIALTSPFGFLAGLLSSVDRRLPFALTLVLCAAAIIIVGRVRDPEFAQEG
jgi:hypothetical protein